MKITVFLSFEAMNFGMRVTTSGRNVQNLLHIYCETKAARLFGTMAPNYQQMYNSLSVFSLSPLSILDAVLAKEWMCDAGNRNPLISHASD